MKKLLCLLLIPLIFATGALIACDTDSVEESRAAVESVPQEESKQEKYVADIPEDVDFKGRTFTFYTTEAIEGTMSEILYNEVITGNESISERVNEAIRERNRLVEEALNIEIKEIFLLDYGRRNNLFINNIRSGVQAGIAEYDVIMPCLYDAATLAADNYLYDLNSEVPYLDTTQPWWEQSFNQELTINNKLYFTVGDIGIVNKSASAVIMFNKNIVENNSLESPYDLVKNNKWTMDKAFSMAKTISIDQNEDGKITYHDSMGWSGQLDDMWHLFYSSGEKIANIGADGYPQLSMYNARSVDVIEKVLTLVQDKEHYLSANDFFGESNYPLQLTIKPFLEGRCLFFSARLYETDNLRDMEEDFGIIPLPMYDENQDRYYTLVNPWSSNCFAIPKSTAYADLEFIGIVLEALGAESKNLVHPAYYDVALKYQRARDDESIEMLDIIFSTRGCDIGLLYSWGELDEALHTIASLSPGSFTSTYQGREEKAKSELQETVGFFK